ncbi:toxin HigB-1 [Antarctobacter heliothermus]|uniref:Toxin HigB-1 n=1 Tax=Antarctobacter heliothermus TaxID=74033 RepID=A0A222E2C4_9RHOB|nr:type II toxin-antitoxin system RelE/ParE family toxin [Antarctobacter heliothermus]ASP20357.1 toxin HigB-1 [Antarctobacter heliothermus]
MLKERPFAVRHQVSCQAGLHSTKGKLATNAVKGKYGKGFLGVLVKRTRAMFTALDAAVVVEDLRFPPGNHLEELKSDRAGQHSVRINGQWRICFVWTPNGPADVEFVDYH